MDNRWHANRMQVVAPSAVQQTEWTTGSKERGYDAPADTP